MTFVLKDAPRCASVADLYAGARLVDRGVRSDLRARLQAARVLYVRAEDDAAPPSDGALAALLAGLRYAVDDPYSPQAVFTQRLAVARAEAQRLAEADALSARRWEWAAVLAVYCLERSCKVPLDVVTAHAADNAREAPPGSRAAMLVLGLATCDPDDFILEGPEDSVRASLIQRGVEMVHPERPALLPTDGDLDLDPRGDDRAGIVLDEDGALAPAQARLAPSCVVLRASGEASSKSAAMEARALVKPIADKALPLAEVPEDIALWERDILREFPHAVDAARALVAAQEGRRWLGGPPIILVGEPGAGKTRLVRRACELVGLPVRRFAADAASDNAFAGTPRRWHSGEVGFPFATILATLTANPVIHIDEIEKGAGDRRTASGRFHDCLVSLWEPESAARYYDPYVEAECNLSHVWYICTANTLDGIPSFLLDRARVVRVPQPGPEHLQVLAPQIARELLSRRGQDPRWGDLDGEELAVLARHWRGGSLRSLTRAVEALLAARDAVGVRHAH